MTAQVQPVPIPIATGINEKPDLTAVEQPTVILNARYARSGALSKRNGYRIATESPLPTTPYAAPEHEYVALDGDKFVARKTREGMAFYQKRGITGASFGELEQRELKAATVTTNGAPGRLRPMLTPLPSMQGPTANEGLLCDLACPTYLLVEQGQVYAYVRLEEVAYNTESRQETHFDIVVEYLDAADPRLTVREASRLSGAVVYTQDVHQQIRAIERNDAGHGLTIVFTSNPSAGGIGIYACSLTPGSTVSADAWGPRYKIVSNTGTAGVAADLRRNSGGFDCDEFLHNSNTGAFSILYATTLGLGWAKVSSFTPLTVNLYDLHHAEGTSPVVVRSVAMTGSQQGSNQEIAYAYVAEWVLSRCYVGRFNATGPGAPVPGGTGLVDDGDLNGRVVPHSAVAGRFHHTAHDTLPMTATYLVGINTGDKGFVYMLGDAGQTALYPNVNTIACAWATGRPHSVYNFRGDLVRPVMPMVSFGGVLGGGAGLLVDIQPTFRYVFDDPPSAQQGAPLLATYSIDQVALSTKSVASALSGFSGAPPIRTADWNAGLRMKPNHGSSIPFGVDWSVPRWLSALGVPPTSTMVELDENNEDFEFIEPGVMMVGPGVPLMLDTIHGVSELGFHTSPPVLLCGGGRAPTAGTGYPLNTIKQYRFQYRFTDGNGLAQVSPLTEPFLVTATGDDCYFDFKLAPLDVTLRHRGAVLIDCYSTEPGLGTFFWAASVTGAGGSNFAEFIDWGPALTVLDKTRTPNVENYFMTPPCATHAFRGSFRDVIVTRENELWPSKRRLSTTAPQFDIVDAAAWDASEPVLAGGEIDGKLVLFSKKRIAYTYELNGTLAPFVDIPSDDGAVEGSRAFSTHLGVFYQGRAGIRIVGRDLALHETGMPVVRTLGQNVIRGGIKVPSQGEIRLRLDDGRTYLVFDYVHGGPDQPVWYVTQFNEQGPYTDEDGRSHASGLRAIADQAFTPDGRLLYLCRLGFVLEETVGRYRDEDQWVTMRVRSGPLRGSTPLAYLASIEGAVNLELPPGAEPGPVTLRLLGDYDDSVPLQPLVTQAWTPAEVEAFDRRQLQITSGERVMNAPALQLEYSDERAGDVSTTSDGYGYRLSAMVVVAGPRDPKTLFPVANGARK